MSEIKTKIDWSRQFKGYPVHSIRMSDKAWKKFREKKFKSSLSWEKFISKLLLK